MKNQINDKSLTIFIEEDLLSTSVQKLRQELLKLFEIPSLPKEIIVDIEKCNIIDSQGLNLMIGLYKETNKRNLTFKVQGSSPTNQRLFTIFKLKELFGISN